jgi:S-adenosylmethionine hydrolase
MPDRPIITLTTDFGCDSPFVGVMKGVILKINPGAEIIDITHGIRPQDIQEAAYTIGMNFRYFPDETLHVVVVDPGVGSHRRPVLIMSDHHYFLGPDNGVFSFIYKMEHETLDVVHVTAEHYFLSKESATFQGRDVFAPVAGWFSRGVGMEKFGDLITDYEKIALPLPQLTPEGELRGEIILVDRFGNAITNITKSDMDTACGAGKGRQCKVIFRGGEIPLRSFYAEGEGGNLCSVVNSSGLLEFFICRGNAADEHHIAVGEKVAVALRG